MSNDKQLETPTEGEAAQMLEKLRAADLDPEKRRASAKEYRDAHRPMNRKERRAALREIAKVERGDYS